MSDEPSSSGPSRLLVAGLAVVLVAVILGLVLVQRVAGTYEDGLEVAAESAAIAADSTGPLQRMTDDLVTFARAAESGLGEARTVLASTQESLEQLGGAAGTDLAETTEGVASLSERVAGVFESIERLIPGNRQSAAEDLRRISDGLAPVPGDLRQLGAQLETTAAELEAADSTMVELEKSVGRLADDLEKLAPTVQDLGAAADRLVERVDDAQGRVSVDLWLARIVIVLIGAVLAIGLLLAERRAP